MNATPILDGLIAAGSTAAVGIVAIAQDLPIAPKDVTVLALVAAIGAWLVRTVDKWGDRTTAAIEKNSFAQAEVSKAMALLMAETSESRKDVSEQRHQIISIIESMPKRVADHCKTNNGKP